MTGAGAGRGVVVVGAGWGVVGAEVVGLDAGLDVGAAGVLVLGTLDGLEVRTWVGALAGGFAWEHPVAVRASMMATAVTSGRCLRLMRSVFITAPCANGLM